MLPIPHNPASLAPASMAKTLGANLGAFRHLVQGLSSSELRWRPAPKKWSLLECLHHMLDEERADFRERARLLIEDPLQVWPTIDPEGWVLERAYNDQDPEHVLGAFEAERAASLLWLQGLPELDLEIAHEHPAMGSLRLGDLLVSWLAHDLLHLAQMARLRLVLLKESSLPYPPSYAGA